MGHTGSNGRTGPSLREEPELRIHRDGPRLLLDGDFDVRSTWEVRAALYAVIADASDGPCDVVMDLSAVQSVDLTALRVLAVATRSAERAGRRLILRGCRPAVRRLVLISHLGGRLDLERPLDPGSEALDDASEIGAHPGARSGARPGARSGARPGAATA